MTIVPETWSEVGQFKTALRATRKAKREIWRRPKPNDEEQTEYFSVFAGKHYTSKRGYRLHWIYSSEKRKRDRASREERLSKAEYALMELAAKLNAYNLKSKEAIEAAVSEILAKHRVEDVLRVIIGTSRESYRVQIGKGRPGKNTQYKRRVRRIYTLIWTRPVWQVDPPVIDEGS